MSTNKQQFKTYIGQAAKKEKAETQAEGSARTRAPAQTAPKKSARR